MEASTYAWAVILTFFVLYGTIQLRKCFLQMLSSGERAAPTNRLSSSSVYTIENDNVVRPFPTDQEYLGRVNSSSKDKDDLPTYEQVIAADKLNPNNRLSASPEISTASEVSASTVAAQPPNVITSSNANIDR